MTNNNCQLKINIYLLIKKDDIAIGLVGGELCVSRAYAAIPIKSIIGPLLLLRSSSIHTFPEHGSFQNTRKLSWGSDKKCRQTFGQNCLKKRVNWC